MGLKRVVVENIIEEQILTGLIVSKEFCRDAVPLVDYNYFQSDYVRRVVKWCKDYYERYETAPMSYVQDMFEVERARINDEEANLIAIFLKRLSDQYSEQDKFNSQYLVDKAIKYFKRRSIAITLNKAQIYCDNDKLEEAETELTRYKQVAKDTNTWVSVFSPETVEKVMNEDRQHDMELFTFPGKLGEIVGMFMRNTLVGVLGAYKRGKSWWLQEIAVLGSLERCKVAFISLEMYQDRAIKRIYRRLTSAKETIYDCIYPVFDCYLNQLGICLKAPILNQIRVATQDGQIIPYNPSLSYQPCSLCRNVNSDYKPAVWYTMYKRNKMTTPILKRLVKGIGMMYGDNLYFKGYPSFSANITRVRNDLDKLEYFSGFIPDIIVIDYADILAPEDRRVIGRDRIDETWKTLKNLADERRCMVVTASQSNRAGIAKKSLGQADIAEDIRKLAHVDLMFTLNQKKDEKRKNVMRIGIIGARDEDFDESRQVMILQQLAVGQPLLDSEIVDISFAEEEDTKSKKSSKNK